MRFDLNSVHTLKLITVIAMSLFGILIEISSVRSYHWSDITMMKSFRIDTLLQLVNYIMLYLIFSLSR
jgi:hypothetical protein